VVAKKQIADRTSVVMMTETYRPAFLDGVGRRRETRAQQSGSHGLEDASAEARGQKPGFEEETGFL
jgi:hypothetical protein